MLVHNCAVFLSYIFVFLGESPCPCRS